MTVTAMAGDAISGMAVGQALRYKLGETSSFTITTIPTALEFSYKRISGNCRLQKVFQ